MDKVALEQSLISLNRYMGRSAIAVAAGILGEYVVDLVYEKNIWRNKLRLSLTILFAVFVFGGVVGEYTFGNRLSKASESLQRSATEEVAQANNEAAQARREAAVSLQQAAMAQERVTENEREAADLRRRAELERAARLRLEAATAPRQLTAEVRNVMVPTLKRFRGQRAQIVYLHDNEEAHDFAIGLFHLLMQAGWMAEGPEPIITIVWLTGPPSVPEYKGVWLRYTSDNPSREAAESLARQLNSAGFDSHLRAISLPEQQRPPRVYGSVEARPYAVQGRIAEMAPRSR